jgi:hypothetical protein
MIKEVVINNVLYFLIQLRDTTVSQINYNFMRSTPFDSPKIPIKIKLSELQFADSKGEKKFLWFNFYKNVDKMLMNVSVKPDANRLPEYWINYATFEFDIEEAPKENGLFNYSSIRY